MTDGVAEPKVSAQLQEKSSQDDSLSPPYQELGFKAGTKLRREIPWLGNWFVRLSRSWFGCL